MGECVTVRCRYYTILQVTWASTDFGIPGSRGYRGMSILVNDTTSLPKSEFWMSSDLSTLPKTRFLKLTKALHAQF